MTAVTFTHCFCPLPPPTRSPAGHQGGKRLHPGHVCESQSKREENDLLPLHLRHGHGQHSICLQSREGPHLAHQPGSLQPGLKGAGGVAAVISIRRRTAGRPQSRAVIQPHAAEHCNPPQETEKPQRLQPNDCTTDIFQNLPPRLFESGRLRL